MTLRDLSTLHEQVVGGYLAPGVLDWRPTFYSLMQESLSFPSWGTDNLSTRIDNYAVLLGMSAAGRDVFKDKLHIAYKPPETITDVLHISDDELRDLRVLCVYGEGEKDTLCPRISSNGIRALRVGTGHHFGGNYDEIADAILQTR